MIVGTDQNNNGHIHLSPGEYERMKNGAIVTTPKEYSEGQFVLGVFFTRKPVRKMTPAMIQRFSTDNVLTVNIQVGLYELATFGDTLDGLNNYVEEIVDDVRIQDISYRAVGVADGNEVIVQVTCDVGEILDELFPHYFAVKPETSGEGVWHLIGQNEAEYGGWTEGDDGGPTKGSIMASEPSFEKIMEHAANYNLDKTPVV